MVDWMAAADRDMVGDLYLSRGGAELVEELVNRFGSRFGGTDEEREAAAFLAERMSEIGLDSSTEGFDCIGWTRRETSLSVLSPVAATVDCIALPYCPPGSVEGRLVWLGDGHPAAYEENRERLRGGIAMVSTATPRFYHRSMHRGEKLGRAVEAGAIGFIWVRDEPGGLPETGSARFGRVCEIPAVSVSYEKSRELVRMTRRSELRVRIASTNSNRPVKSYNVVGELRGSSRADEVVVIGGHYDGHDVSQSANDNAAGIAVALEAARALVPHAGGLERTFRFVAFAQEEMGLLGSVQYVKEHADERIVFMLNLDGAGRGSKGILTMQGWPEAVGLFRRLCDDMGERHILVGDQIGLYSDMYPFAAAGIPAAAYVSAEPVSGGAPRGFGHTAWDSLDKLNERALQFDALFVARLALRLGVGELAIQPKTPAELGSRLKLEGLDEVLRYELRPVPGEE